VESMFYMFCRAEAFNQPLADWDVSKVENMGGMFAYAASFNQPLANWNVSNVKNMKYMFSSAWRFNQPLADWGAHVDSWGMFDDHPLLSQNKPARANGMS